MLQIKRIGADYIVLSGRLGKQFKQNQPVIVKAYDEISIQQRKWYRGVLIPWLMDKLNVDNNDTIHSSLRYQVGFTEYTIHPNGYEVEVPKSTKSNICSSADFQQYLDKLWFTLNSIGYKLGRNHYALPEDLELWELQAEYKTILELRKVEKEGVK